jgi:hypothetical protein
MTKGTPISPKHGLNPSMLMCVWCGKEKGIAILGRLPDDAEAPRKIYGDIDPCDSCKEEMAQGISIIAVTSHPPKNGMPPLTNNPHPLYMTGSWCVVKEEFLDAASIPDADKKDIREQRAMIVDAHVFDDIMRNIEAAS